MYASVLILDSQANDGVVQIFPEERTACCSYIVYVWAGLCVGWAMCGLGYLFYQRVSQEILHSADTLTRNMPDDCGPTHASLPHTSFTYFILAD